MNDVIFFGFDDFDVVVFDKCFVCYVFCFIICVMCGDGDLLV